MKLIGFALALFLAFAIGHATPQIHTNAHAVNIYEDEDLSGTAYSEPINTLNFAYSAGYVCYANDASGRDNRQMYADCNQLQKMGVYIAPAS